MATLKSSTAIHVYNISIWGFTLAFAEDGILWNVCGINML